MYRPEHHTEESEINPYSENLYTKLAELIENHPSPVWVDFSCWGIDRTAVTGDTEGRRLKDYVDTFFSVGWRADEGREIVRLVFFTTQDNDARGLDMNESLGGSGRGTIIFSVVRVILTHMTSP